MMVIPETRHGK